FAHLESATLCRCRSRAETHHKPRASLRPERADAFYRAADLFGASRDDGEPQAGASRARGEEGPENFGLQVRGNPPPLVVDTKQHSRPSRCVARYADRNFLFRMR